MRQYLERIAAEKTAQAVARLQLENPPSLQKRTYHLITGILLSLPLIRLTVFFALKFFVGLRVSLPPPVVVSDLNQLWQEQKIEELVRKLRAEGTASWAPSVHLRKAPPMPETLKYIRAYCIDLTQQAEDGKLRPFFGREREFQQMSQILGRFQKSNPMLLGPPGVGKTAMGEGLALKIVAGDGTLHPAVQGKRVFLLKWEQISAGTEKYSANTVPSRLLALLKEACEHRDSVTIFIDEVHAFLNPQNEGVVNILKPALADGSFSCITATTTWDYKRLIENDPALERRFPIVDISEPKQEDVRRMLQAVAPVLEAHHGVRISDAAIDEAIRLGARYIKHQSFPDKALDLLDQAASRLNAQEKPHSEGSARERSQFLRLLLQMRLEVSDPSFLNQAIAEERQGFGHVVEAEHIRAIVAERVELPLERLQSTEQEILQNLEVLLAKNIIGQKRSLRSLAQGVRRARVKIGNPDAPAGVFLMVGPTGIGKTASVEALATILYGSKKKLLRLDMGEYIHAADVNKLIGAPPGYSGHGRGGILTNWLKANPGSIVLLDEIEKANSEIWNLFLGVFDAGVITDSNQETFRCLDTTFVMTSNVGAREIHKFWETHLKDKGDADDASDEALRDSLEGPLKKCNFRPEFLNRIQEITIFYPLSEDEIRQIALMQCEKLRERLKENAHCPNLQIVWDDKLIDFLVKHGYRVEKGARELARCITRYMENPLADAIVRGEIVPGAVIYFTVESGKVVFKKTRSAGDEAEVKA